MSKLTYNKMCPVQLMKKEETGKLLRKIWCANDTLACGLRQEKRALANQGACN